MQIHFAIKNLIYKHAIDKLELCKKALDLSNGTLIVENDWSKWPLGTHCQWLISAVDDEHYVNLEFENIDVGIAELNYLPCLILLSFYLDHILDE